jgi:hypothetical protein
MNLSDDDRIKQRHHSAKYQFVMTELDLAITFAKISLSAEDPDKAERNRGHADQAFAAARHFVRGANLTRKMRLEVEERVEQIRHLMSQFKKSPNHRAVPHI